MAQLRRLVVVLSRPVKPVRCDARVRVGLAEREEVDPRLEGADLCGNQPVRRVLESFLGDDVRRVSLDPR